LFCRSITIPATRRLNPPLAPFRTHPVVQTFSRTCMSTTLLPWPGRTCPPQRQANPRLQDRVTASRRQGASSTSTVALIGQVYQYLSLSSNPGYLRTSGAVSFLPFLPNSNTIFAEYKLALHRNRFINAIAPNPGDFEFRHTRVTSHRLTIT
jgi:hypothetical protein